MLSKKREMIPRFFGFFFEYPRHRVVVGKIWVISGISRTIPFQYHTMVWDPRGGGIPSHPRDMVWDFIGISHGMVYSWDISSHYMRITRDLKPSLAVTVSQILLSLLNALCTALHQLTPMRGIRVTAYRQFYIVVIILVIIQWYEMGWDIP